MDNVGLFIDNKIVTTPCNFIVNNESDIRQVCLENNISLYCIVRKNCKSYSIFSSAAIAKIFDHAGDQYLFATKYDEDPVTQRNFLFLSEVTRWVLCGIYTSYCSYVDKPFIFLDLY